MLDPEELLKQIEGSGTIEDSNSLPGNLKKVIKLNENLGQVLDTSSGKTRIRPAKVGLFNVILSQPAELEDIHSFEIRCLNCSKVLTYPGYLAKIGYDRNVFYYFLCFNNGNVSLECK